MAVSTRHGRWFRSVRTLTSIVFEKTLFKITRNASVVNRLVCLTNQNVNVEECVNLLACQAVLFGAPVEKIKRTARLDFVTAWQPSLLRCRSKAKAGPARIRTWDQGIMSPLL
jgi:hypothetical protein